MKKKRVLTKISADIEVEAKEAIQEYADLFCEGVFARAVREIIKKGLIGANTNS